MISTSIEDAKQLLQNDGIIGFPTETVYGLAGNAFSEKSIRSIFHLKKRPYNNPLIVHIGNFKQLENISQEIPMKARLLAEQFWPGPLTLLLKKSSEVSDLVTAGQSTVAVRMPNHSRALDLLNSLDFPLVAPSANPYQSISPTSAKHVERYFGNQGLFILEGGESINGLESTIVGFEDDEVIVYRLGAIPLEELENTVGQVRLNKVKKNGVVSPGMAAKHYAPKTPLIFTDSLSERIEQFETKDVAVICFDKLPNLKNMENSIIYSFQGHLGNAAKRLYGLLHELDDRNLECILIEKFPDQGLGRTINDRLKRAAALK
jgi:L-threonylcarbamoyladenylate synthase